MNGFFIRLYCFRIRDLDGLLEVVSSFETSEAWASHEQSQKVMEATLTRWNYIRNQLGRPELQVPLGWSALLLAVMVGENNRILRPCRRIVCHRVLRSSTPPGTKATLTHWTDPPPDLHAVIPYVLRSLDQNFSFINSKVFHVNQSVLLPLPVSEQVSIAPLKENPHSRWNYLTLLCQTNLSSIKSNSNVAVAN